MRTSRRGSRGGLGLRGGVAGEDEDEDFEEEEELGADVGPLQW